MSLSNLTEPDAILSAISECDILGREVFLRKYKFHVARSYFLIHEGKEYDSKAIVGAAHGYQFPDLGPLKAANFNGGDATVRRKLEELGFVVKAAAPLIDWKKFCQELMAQHPDFHDYRIETNYLRAPDDAYTHIALVYGRRRIGIQLVLQDRRMEEANAHKEKLERLCKAIDPTAIIELNNTEKRIRLRLYLDVGDPSDFDQSEAKDWYLNWWNVFEPFWREEVNRQPSDQSEHGRFGRQLAVSRQGRLVTKVENQIFDEGLEPSSIEDARIRTERSIVQRRGQAGFRNDLLVAYRGCCPVTGCDVPAALEAAHIHPYRGEATNVVSNGLLLRADIHTLFDQGLIAISPTDFRLIIADELVGTIYEELNGKILSLPVVETHRPNPELLRWHRNSWGL